MQDEPVLTVLVADSFGVVTHTRSPRECRDLGVVGGGRNVSNIRVSSEAYDQRQP